MPLDRPEEQFEVFDNDGEPTGLVSRSVVHAQGLWHQSANVFVHNRDARLLLQRRAVHKDVCPGHWDLGCGEHLMPNESFEQAAVRGLCEELGVTTEAAALVSLGSPGRYEYRDDLVGVYDREIHRCFAVLWDGPIRIDPSEVEQIRWVTWHSLSDDVNANPGRYTPWLIHWLGLLPPIDEWLLK